MSFDTTFLAAVSALRPGDTPGKASAEITSIINQMNDISNTIAAAVEEQTVTTTGIGSKAQEATQGSGEIAHNIAGVACAKIAEPHCSQAVHEMAAQPGQLVMQDKLRS